MKFFQIILLILISNLNYAQETEQLRMVDFSPKTGAYNIYHPNTYIVKESDSTGSNIVIISNLQSGLNITISSYQNSKKIKESDLLEVFNGFLENPGAYNWQSYKSKFDVLIEGKTLEKGIYWIWYGISLKNKMVVLSVNKEKEFSAEETDLIRFMIDNLEIH